jgi:hypothetical protein
LLSYVFNLPLEVGGEQAVLPAGGWHWWPLIMMHIVLLLFKKKIYLFILPGGRRWTNYHLLEVAMDGHWSWWILICQLGWSSNDGTWFSGPNKQAINLISQLVFFVF